MRTRGSITDQMVVLRLRY